MSNSKGFTGLSICVPALNEEKGLKGTIHKLQDSLQRLEIEHEIIIINDGSKDSTGSIADLFALKSINISVIHNDETKGRGLAFRDGLIKAKLSHYMLLNGKDDTYVDELIKVFQAWKNDPDKLIISYQKNTDERDWFRRQISYIFTWTNNKLFSQNIHYYNNPTVFPVNELKNISLKNNSYAFQAEAIIKLLKNGVGYKEVGTIDRIEEHRKTRGLTLSNLYGIANHFVTTWKDVRRENAQ